MLKKNVAGQTWLVFAFNRLSGVPVVGDAGNITALLVKDDGTPTATSTVNPTEITRGFYRFPMTKAETNASTVDLLCESASVNVQVVAIDTRQALGPVEATIASTTVIQIDNPTPVDAGEFEIVQRSDYVNDTEIYPIGPIRIETLKPLLQAVNPPLLRFGATKKIGFDFFKQTDVGKHILGTAYAVVVANQPNQYDLFIEITKAQLDVPPGEYGWDIDAIYFDNEVTFLVGGTVKVRQSMGNREEAAP